MNELWESVASLGEARHQVVMFLLNRAFSESDSCRLRRIFGVVDEINRLVDDLDKSDARAISRVRDMLNGGLDQLQRGALNERASGSWHSAPAIVVGRAPLP